MTLPPIFRTDVIKRALANAGHDVDAKPTREIMESVLQELRATDPEAADLFTANMMRGIGGLPQLTMDQFRQVRAKARETIGPVYARVLRTPMPDSLAPSEALERIRIANPGAHDELARSLTAAQDPDKLTPEREAARREAAAVFNFEFVTDMPDGIPESDRTFTTYLVRKETEADESKAMREAVWAWINGTSPAFLTLAGGVGAGKTHLLEAGAKWLRSHGREVMYRTEYQLMDDMRPHSLHRDTALNAFCTVPYLVWDDFGVSDPTSWVKANAEHIVDARYSAGLRTLIATNLTGRKMAADLSARIASRLADVERSRIVSVALSDFRVRR